MKTLTADDWKAERKWEEYMLMIKTMHNVTLQMKEEKENQVACTWDRKRGAKW